MENDNQIASTEVSFQPFSEKFVTIRALLSIQNQFRGMSESAFCLRIYFTHAKMCNPNRDYDLNYCRNVSLFFFKVNQPISLCYNHITTKLVLGTRLL